MISGNGAILFRTLLVFAVVLPAEIASPTAFGDDASEQQSQGSMGTIALVRIDSGLRGAALLHPYAFNEDELKAIMRSIRYSTPGVMGWEDSRQIFGEELVNAAVERFRLQLSQAGPDQKIIFSFRQGSGNTSGDVFVREGFIHWRLDRVQGIPHFDANPSAVEFESETEMTPNWILQPSEDQQHASRRGLFRSRKPIRNWLQIPVDGAMPATHP